MPLILRREPWPRKIPWISPANYATVRNAGASNPARRERLDIRFLFAYDSCALT